MAQRFYRNRFWATRPPSGYLLRRSRPELFLIGQTPSMSNPSSEAPPRDVALLFTAEEIARKVVSLADEIASAMADPFTAVVILKGAFMFGADLIRALSRRGRHPQSRVHSPRQLRRCAANQRDGEPAERTAGRDRGTPRSHRRRRARQRFDAPGGETTDRELRSRGGPHLRPGQERGQAESADACGFRRVHDRRPLRRRLRHRLRRELSRLAVSCGCRPQVRPRSARTGRRPPARGR